MPSNTIFFEGFGPWGGEHVSDIDESYWDKSPSGSISLSEYRTDKSTSTVNGTLNGKDFLGYTFGATAKLLSYSTGTPPTLTAKNFPSSFSTTGTGFGIGFYTNKIATDSADYGTGPYYPANLLELSSTSGAMDVDVLKLEAIHVSTTGYASGIAPQVGIRVSQTGSVVGSFTFDVWGAPWYIENRNNISPIMQRTVDAYNYKYGGLYVEVCVVPDADPLDATKPYSLQVKVNGMNLTVDGTDEDKKLYLTNCFSNSGINFFNQMTFYGSRIPTTGNNNENPFTTVNGSPYATHLYHTYLDNIYVIEGATDNDCLLGPTTKVFNIIPQEGGARVNDDWSGFTLAWDNQDFNNLERNLKDNNGDSSYVYTETSGSVLAMPMVMSDNPANPIPSGVNYAIGGIKITNSVRKSNQNTSFQNVWGTGTTSASMSGIGTNFSITNNHYEYKNQYLLNNPITATGWTFPDVINGKFGIKKTS